MTIFDLPPITAIPALRRRFDRQRKVGKFILAIWHYMSVTRVYFMLDQWFPPTHFEQLKRRYQLKMHVASQ
jgi:hypothetical protein